MSNFDVKQFALRLGADVCGVAGVDRFAAAPEGFHPRDILPGVRSVVVFGKQLPKGIFTIKSMAPYMMARNHIVREIDAMANALTMELEREGHVAIPIPSAEPYEFWDEANREGRGILSLKHAAQLAGVGHIGRNTLLINRKYGNRLWLGAILTDLELAEDDFADSRCPKGCRLCLDACPVQALDGTTIVQKKCRQICFTSTPGGGELYACSACRKACPFCMV